jgi:hypothetical protein
MTCQYCGLSREGFPKDGRSWGAHIRNCFKRPDRVALNLAVAKKNKRKVLYPVQCVVCGKQFLLECTPKQFSRRKGLTCSVSCSNTRPCLLTTRRRISQAHHDRVSLLPPKPPKRCACGQEIPRNWTVCLSCRKLHNEEGLAKAKAEGRCGGIREGGGRSKSGYYHGMFVQSTWECAYLIHSLQLGKKVERNWRPLSYEFEGVRYNFYPDFLVDGNLVEIKGWPSARTSAKQQQCPQVQFLFEKELQPTFSEVASVTGLPVEKLWRLYD